MKADSKHRDRVGRDGPRPLRFFAIATTAAMTLVPLRAGGGGAPVGGYAIWLQAYFPVSYGHSDLEQTVWGDNADLDDDGCTNLMEFVMNRNPIVSDAGLGVRCRIDGEDFVATYRETTTQGPGVVWHGEWSVDSEFWVASGVRYSVLETHPGHRVVEARISRNGETTMFFRISARRGS